MTDDNTTLPDMYHQMVLIRRFEEKCAELYAKGDIGGFLHLYIGQEAVAVGAISALTDDDHVITAYRDHGQAIARGLDVNALMAEMTGKSTGVSKGKGGSMHLADVSKNFWGGHAVVGAHLSLAAGIGLALQYEEKPGAVLCFFGDGATNIGYFHESLNLSGVWDLPILWLCENNRYGMGTAVKRASAVEHIMQKAAAYGIPAEQVDGMDVMAVQAATQKALEHVRGGSGPYFLEVMTYRYRGHSMGDPERYREPEEIEKWQEEDPIGRFHNYLINEGLASEKELDETQVQVDQEIDEAVRFAEESPLPGRDDLYADVYV
jgi:pyruvate dehydrogenase E1 component alpha subunit